MWARIENNAVVEMTESDPSGRFHASLEWVKCPSGVVVGMLFKDGKFSEAPVDLDVLAKQARFTRDKLLRTIYDPAIMAAMRMSRIAEDPAVSAWIEALDAYAVALQDVPQQAGFPTTIEWPEAPAL